jgi:hypothetical protein
VYVTLMAAQDPCCEVLCEKSTSYRGSAFFRCTTTCPGVSTPDTTTSTLSSWTVTRKASLLDQIVIELGVKGVASPILSAR